MAVDFSKVVSLERMVGDDEEDTALLRQAHEKARSYLSGFKWCDEIRESYFGLGIGGVVAVFLFRIDAPPHVDEWLWVIVGDLPSAYLVTEDNDDPVTALETYCCLMAEWVEAVRNQASLDEVYPAGVPTTEANALALASRIEFLRREIIPMYE